LLSMREMSFFSRLLYSRGIYSGKRYIPMGYACATPPRAESRLTPHFAVARSGAQARKRGTLKCLALLLVAIDLPIII
jgi:hypothetical protein